jgi:predicted dehydrogenase
MRAGKAVYVEKPCCFCPHEGEILLDVWNRTGMVFQMGNQRRASLPYREAIEYVRTSGDIGELKWAKCWYMSNRASIGRGKPVAVPQWLDWELWQGPAPRCEFRDNIVHYKWHWFRNWGTAESGNNAPHFADAARWALGVGHPSSVQCSSGMFFRRQDDDYEWPDTFNASFKYPGNKFITFELASHCNQKPSMNVGTGALVYGEKGVLFLAPNDVAELYDVNGKKVKEWKAQGSTKAGSLTDPTNTLDGRHMAKYVECIRTRDRNTNSPADEAVKSTMMPLMMNVASEMGEEIRFDVKSGKPITKIPDRLWSREYAKGWELV